MRKLIPLVLLLALTAGAQEATYNTPATRTAEAKYAILNFNVSTGPLQANITLSIRDSGNVEIRQQSFQIPGSLNCPAATVAGLGTAMVNTRATETGSDLRKLSFRILGYLSDQGCISGVTLAP